MPYETVLELDDAHAIETRRKHVAPHRTIQGPNAPGAAGRRLCSCVLHARRSRRCRRVATAFGLTKAELAKSLGLAEDTLHRFSRATAPDTQRRLRELLEILARVEPWAGGRLQALAWYRGRGIPALGDATAEALVRRDQAHVVRAWLDAYAAGAHA